MNRLSILSFAVVVPMLVGVAGISPAPADVSAMWAAPPGKTLAQAYQAIHDAPGHSYNYASALQELDSAPAGVAGPGASYLRVLALVCDGQLPAAAEVARKMGAWTPPGSAAGHVIASDPGSLEDLEISIADHSGLAPRLPGSKMQALFRIYDAVALRGLVDLLGKMPGDAIYVKARAMLENLPAESALKPVLAVLQKECRQYRPADPRQMAQIAAVLALGAGPLGPGLERVKSDLDAAICAWQLRGMGVAFHLFLLDHQGHFPLGTVRAGSPTQDELDWIGLLKPYLGFEREIKIIGSWSGKPDRLDLLPAQFLCPARQHHWTTVATRGSEYGYIDSVGSPARNSKTLDGSLANCTALTYADINPPRQILVVESTSGGRYYSPAQLAVPHEELGNVLFADGHVEAHELDWAKKMNPYAAPSPDNPWRTLPPPGGDKP